MTVLQALCKHVICPIMHAAHMRTDDTHTCTDAHCDMHTHRHTRASTLAYTHTCKHTLIHEKKPLHIESSSLTSAQAHIHMHKPRMFIIHSTTIMYCTVHWNGDVHMQFNPHTVSLHLPMTLFLVICTLNSCDSTFHNGIDTAKRSLSWETILWFEAVFFVFVWSGVHFNTK